MGPERIVGQWGNPDSVRLRKEKRLSDCKLFAGAETMSEPGEKATPNCVPAAEVIRMLQVLSGFTGCKAEKQKN